MKHFLSLAIVLSSFIFSLNAISSEQTIEEKALLTPIMSLFDAMRDHDKNKILAQFTEEAMLQRVTKNNEIKQTKINDFASSVGESKNKLDEQLFNISYNVEGNLASVWTPFVFYLNGKISHCGINSFQLIKQGEQWKIHYLIDNAFQGNCLKFSKN